MNIGLLSWIKIYISGKVHHWLCLQSCLVLGVCLLSLNQDMYLRKGTILVMLAKLHLWVCLLPLNQDIHWRELRYSIGNVGKTASMSMLTLFESRYTLKGRYSIGNVGKTASMSTLTLGIKIIQTTNLWKLKDIIRALDRGTCIQALAPPL